MHLVDPVDVRKIKSCAITKIKAANVVEKRENERTCPHLVFNHNVVVEYKLQARAPMLPVACFL